ncbi:MAG: hypothetical protein J6B30_00965 [Muribaculaceae bacterium]|nr:hypothetical protein [Muribaculaceae bacterium]
MKITKLNFKHLLLLLCSFVFATNASAQTFEVNAADWIIYSETNDFSVGSIYLQSAVTDGAIFTLPAPTATSDMHPESPADQQCTKGYKIYKSGSNVVAETFSGGSALEHYPV